MMSRNNGSDGHKAWQRKSLWQRGLAMFLFAFIGGFLRLGISLLAVVQFILMLLQGAPNRALLRIGRYLNNYIYQINQFLCFNTEHYPFPFNDWPLHAAPADIASEGRYHD